MAETAAEELTQDGYDGDGELDQDETEGDTTEPERGDEQSAEDDD